MSEVESLNHRDWKKFESNPKFESFMDMYLTALCVDNYWWFRMFGVYHNAMAHYDASLYDATARFLQTWKREDGTHIRTKFLVMARESCKTQDTLAWDAWQFVRNQNQRLLFRAYADAKAHELLLALRNILQSPSFAHRFPWVHPARKRNGTEVLWKEDRILIEREEMSLRSPSVEACGIDSDPTGSHFNLRHCDDMETQANAYSEVGLKKMLAKFLNDVNLMEAGSKTVVCGTPWIQTGLINGVVQRQGDFANHDYDVMLVPSEIKIFDNPYDFPEPVLLPDRETVRCEAAGFPTSEATLCGCQAQVTFFSKAARDTVVEIREIVWNDGSHFRVNRPFPEPLGDPLQCHVGNVKPAALNRWTLDSVDWIPGEGSKKIARKSLVASRREQGSMVYNCQMLLNPVDPASLVFNEQHIDKFPLELMPTGNGKWFRAIDLATAKQSDSATAITTGFFDDNGLWITHMLKEDCAQPLDILLELFLGTLRIQDKGGSLQSTFYESGNIERTILNSYDIQEAQRNPYEYFKGRGGKYEQAAETMLKDRGPVFLRLHEISRGGNETKIMRIAWAQPFVEAKMLHVMQGCKSYQQLMDEINTLTMSSSGMFDLLDTISTIIRNGRPPKKQQNQGNINASFIKEQQRAMFRINGSAALRGWR